MEEQKDKKDKKVRKDKRLSSKINSRFIALTLIAILCTMILSTTVYYDLFKKEIMRDLENYTQTLKSAGLFDDISELRNVRIKNTELRITLVAPDGTVKYDNMADPETMENTTTDRRLRRHLRKEKARIPVFPRRSI